MFCQHFSQCNVNWNFAVRLHAIGMTMYVTFYDMWVNFCQ